ncbi:hypothetical protein PENTCL1PPCAC_16103, partial [Pristionchus entomophagus]
MKQVKQVVLIIQDVHLEVGIQAIPLFPALAGYCVGLFTQLGMPIYWGMGILIIIWIYLGVSIVSCIIHRHQTVVLSGNTFKLQKKTLVTLDVMMVVLWPIPVIVWALTDHDQATSEKLLIDVRIDPRNITWIRDRGVYYMEKQTPYVTLTMVSNIVILFAGTAFCMAIFAHMFHTLRKDRDKRSLSTIRLIRRSLIVLFVQV